MTYAGIEQAIRQDAVQLARIYAENIEGQRERYLKLLDSHKKHFDNENGLCMISSPGRCELIGNHTDHNNGIVMAAAIQQDAVAAVSKRTDGAVIIKSEGYPPIRTNMIDLSVQERLKGSSAALIKGVAKGMLSKGFKIGGFEACVHSNVLSGSGMSSSAAFEVLICAIMDKLYNSFSMDPILRAKISQFAENVYFMKPSGLMDQMAVSVGGLVKIDFEKEEPAVFPLRYSFLEKGYRMVLVNTGGSHDDLTEEYAAIRREMQASAKHIAGKKTLRETSMDMLLQHAGTIRKSVSERAFLRALHFFNENDRVNKAFTSLCEDDFEGFLSMIRASGKSSWMLLQNMWANPMQQQLSMSVAFADEILGESSASRVHGGGFAGTTLHFVKKEELQKFINRMESVFGKGAALRVDVRNDGPLALF